DDGKGEVEHSQQVAQQYGIQGVPFYIIAGEQALSGAQPVEAFEAALVRFA
ncbi:MAG: DsbA family protein, partial [Bacteroidota bacterium]